MQKPQLSGCEVLLTMVEIDQLIAHQIEGHGIDREIAARKVSLESARLHHGILGKGGVVLLSRRRQIEGNSIQLKRHRAEGPMLLNIGDAFRTDLANQFRDKRSGISLHNPVQIGHTRPGSTTALMQQLIAHDATDQRQT